MLTVTLKVLSSLHFLTRNILPASQIAMKEKTLSRLIHLCTPIRRCPSYLSENQCKRIFCTDMNMAGVRTITPADNPSQPTRNLNGSVPWPVPSLIFWKDIHRYLTGRKYAPPMAEVICNGESELAISNFIVHWHEGYFTRSGRPIRLGSGLSEDIQLEASTIQKFDIHKYTRM